MKKALVIAAHPDDELLGCGGTVIRLARAGYDVRAILVCEGESLRYAGQQVHQSAATDEAKRILGFSRVYRLDLPDQRLDTLCLLDVISPIEHIVSEFEPDLVLCQHGGDINRDHRIVNEAAMVALRPLDLKAEIYTFYTVGSTAWGEKGNFTPDVWVDISEVLDEKIRAFECYTSEVRPYPHPRSSLSLRNLAYAAGNEVGLEAAETFCTVRRILKNV